MTKPPGLIIPFRYRNPEYFGGIERKILTIAKWFYEHELFFPILAISHPDSSFGRSFEKLGLPVHSLGPEGLLGIPKCIENLEHLAVKYNVQAIESHQFRDSILGSIVRRRNKKIRHLFRVHTHIEGSAISSKKLTLYHWLDWASHFGVDHYCVLSHVLKSELTSKSRIPSRKVSVVRNGIPALSYFKSPISNDRPLQPEIVCVGELEPRKRQDMLVDAVAMLQKQYGLDVRILLVGGGEQKFIDFIKGKSQQLGVSDLVTFTGRLDSVAEVAGNIDIHVLPSAFEGIPTGIVEAMSIGKVVVATDVGGTRELIENRRNGFLIPPNNLEALVETLKEILIAPSSKWDSMRLCAHETWRYEFTIEVMMSGLIDGFFATGIDLKHPR